MHTYKGKIKGTLSSSSEGEIGGLSVRGPLLCESLPDVNGDTSCYFPNKQTHHYYVYCKKLI